MNLSAVVITRNEERNLERCLRSLLFCDEIIVVDAQSEDATVAIARRFTEKVFVRPWEGYVDQKNFATSCASFEWVLSIDADEEVPPDLAKEIKETLSNTSAAAFAVGRKTFHSGRWIRFGGWYPNRLVRLYQKRQGSWQGDQVHERWNTAGIVGDLGHDLNHYSFRDIADQVERNNRYSSLSAQSLRQSGRSFSLVKLTTKSFLKFIETYFAKRGFLDGLPGFFISVSAAYSVFLKWAKLWELENGSKT